MTKDIIETARQFAEAISRQNADDIYALMSEDHVFIDSDGAAYGDTEKMRQGWSDYFKMFPDYRLNITETFSSGDTVVFLGTASGTYTRDGNLKPENHWEVTAAWKAVISNEKVKIWQVFVNVERIRDIINKENEA